MKKSFAKKLLVLCLSAVLAVGVGFGFAGIKTVEADSVKYNFREIAEQYDYNSKVTLPNRASYNNRPVTNGTVTFPNGMMFSAGSEITLDQYGMYTVSYQYVTTTTTRVIYDTFVVKQEYFSLSTNNGSYVESIADITDPVVLNHSTRKEGINVALKEGCEIVFNKPVDLKNVGENGLCDIISISPIIGSYRPLTYSDSGSVATYAYEQYVDDVVVTLTDAYDASIFVTFRFDFNLTQTGYAYIRSGTNTQEENGITKTTDSVGRWDKIPFYYQDQLYMSWFGAYGGQGGQSMSTYAPTTCYKCGEQLGTISVGMTQIKCTNDKCNAQNQVRLPKGITLQYDPVNDITYFDNGSGSTLLSMFRLADSYSSGTTLFSGFTTGEVIVSMKAQTYTKPTAYIEVLQIGDIDGATLVSNMGKETLADDRDPEIVINAKMTDDNGVYAAIGDTFYIPSAKAYDVNLASDVMVNVYKNYGQANQTSVNVNTADNSFLVEELATYTIEYSAVDASGNVGKNQVYVNPVDVSGNVNSGNEIFLNKGILFATNKIPAASFKAGHEIVLPAYTLRTLNDEDSLKIDILANANGKTYNIDPVSRSFVPETTGTYTITYAISDNVSSYVETYTIDCTSDNTVRFATKPFSYRHYIAGMKYEIEKPVAYRYENAPVEVPTTAWASFDGGAFEEIKDVHNFLIKENASSVRFEFRAEGAAPVAPAAPSKIVNVKSTVQGETIAAENYFQFDNNAFTVTDGSDIIFTTNHTFGSSNKISFINPLTYGSLTLGFKTFEDKANFSVFNVILTDIYDENNKVVIKFENSNGTLYASINGQQRTMLTGDKFFSNKKKNISYDYNRRKLTIVGTTLDYEVKFASQYCYVDFELQGVTEESAVAINTIQAVNFSKNLVKDNSKPSGFITRDNGNKKINTTVTIYSPDIADVLTPTLYDKITVSVIDDEGNYAVATDGTVLNGTANDPRLDYDLLLSKYTTYTVTIDAKDVSTLTKEPLKELYKIYVVDDHAPVITLTHGFTPDTVMNVDLGLPFKIEYSVTDDITPSDELMVHVVIFSKYGQYTVYASKPHESLADGVYELITDECIITRKGEYTLYIEAQDAVGNASFVSYKLNVQ